VEYVGCRFVHRMEVRYVLDAKKLSSAKLDRALFPHNDSSGRAVEEPTMTGSLMMHEQWRERDACQTHLVYISVSLRNFICLSTALILSSVLYRFWLVT